MVEQGKTIESYPADTPYPSRLLLGFVGGRALHVVVADNADDDETIVVTPPGKTTVVLQRDHATVVINDVPARVCENCGEEYVDDKVAESVLASAQASARAGVRVEIRDYVAA